MLEILVMCAGVYVCAGLRYKATGCCPWGREHNLETMEGDRALTVLVYTKSVVIKLTGTASLFLPCPYLFPVAHLCDAVMFSCKLTGIM